METLTDFKKFSFSTQFAIISFVFGTLLFLLYFLIPDIEGIVILGLFYLIFAIFFNGFILLTLVLELLTQPDERQNTIIKILILLANIPIAILYFLIITKQLNKLSPF